MTTVVLLEWIFSPPDYFEAPLDISHHDYTMTIADGRVEAKIDSTTFDANPSIRKMLHDTLNDRFLGVEVLTHQAYLLSSSMITHVHDDGRRDIVIETESGSLGMTGESVDLRITAKDGTIIADTKRDRIERKKRFGELVAIHRSSDPTFAAMLRGHDAAVRDPHNELVHLYEIRDALSTRFGGESEVRSVLSISRSTWSRFGELCNDEPLQQGRHRGMAAGALRSATEAELTEARGIALAMIEAYVQYLEAPA